MDLKDRLKGSSEGSPIFLSKLKRKKEAKQNGSYWVAFFIISQWCVALPFRLEKKKKKKRLV